jgi:hypothetical protein
MLSHYLIAVCLQDAYNYGSCNASFRGYIPCPYECEKVKIQPSSLQTLAKVAIAKHQVKWEKTELETKTKLREIYPDKLVTSVTNVIFGIRAKTRQQILDGHQFQYCYVETFRCADINVDFLYRVYASEDVPFLFCKVTLL